MHRFRSQRARNVLSVVQIAATLVLLVNGGAILRTMQQLETIDPGMRVDGVLTLGSTSKPPATATTRRCRWRHACSTRYAVWRVDAAALAAVVRRLPCRR